MCASHARTGRLLSQLGMNTVLVKSFLLAVVYDFQSLIYPTDIH